jgi:hypothetical protein
MKSILLSVFLVLFSVSAFAEDHAAVDFNIDFDCGMGPAELCIFGESSGFVTRTSMTPSGNILLKCSCFPTGGAAIETTRMDNFPCSTEFGLTTDSHFVWTEGGRASLTCVIHPDDQP